LGLKIIFLNAVFKLFDCLLQVQLSGTWLMTNFWLIILSGPLSGWSICLRVRIIIQKVVIHVFNLTLEIILILLLRSQVFVIFIINSLQNHAQFTREELVNVIHEEILGELELFRHRLNFIIVIINALHGFPD